MQTSNHPRPNYGIDAPVIGLRLLVVLIGALAIGGFLNSFSNEFAKSIARILFGLIPTGFILIGLMIYYVKIGKFRHRDRMLNMLTWNGDEQVLDVGTGHGLLMIGAAKRLTIGKSFGIDIWKKEDLSDNRYDSALKNATIEGVSDKVEIFNADARRIPFADNAFDYVLSNLCLHNIKDKKGRESACLEIARVLKPGGTALISDFTRTGEYVAELSKYGLDTTRLGPFFPGPMFLRIVRAIKK